MADKRFDNHRFAARRRETAKRCEDSWELRLKQEEKFLKKQKEIQKYANVVNIIIKELSKRKNIQCTYIKLYPIIKEVIENSKYLSSRYGEEDFTIITSEVVRKYYHILNNEYER